MNYTPGPWKTRGSFVYRDDGEHDGVVCRVAYSGSCVQWVCGVASRENAANARLISVAPELYEALRSIVSELREYNPTGIALADATALLARVSGE